jgi:hypothetical protein
MNKEISLEIIMSKLEDIERMLAGNQHQQTIQAGVLPSSFLPGGKDWFLMASDEERREFNRKRGQSSRRNKK